MFFLVSWQNLDRQNRELQNLDTAGLCLGNKVKDRVR